MLTKYLSLSSNFPQQEYSKRACISSYVKTWHRLIIELRLPLI